MRLVDSRMMTWSGAVAIAAILGAGGQAVAQGTQTKQVMRLKLAESQQLLGALVTSNWAALGRHGRELDALTRSPGWEAILLPEFTKFTAGFQRANDALVAAADRRDQMTALMAYNALVTSCVECHRYVARARLANQRSTTLPSPRVPIP